MNVHLWALPVGLTDPQKDQAKSEL